MSEDVLAFKCNILNIYCEQIRLNDCQISDFELGDILGTGSFGRVYFAHHVPTLLVCCVKSMSKAAIIKTKQVPLSSSKNPKHVSQSHNQKHKPKPYKPHTYKHLRE